MKIKMASVAGRSPRRKVPVTIINVKPYHIIKCGTKISCDGETGFPLVFDTFCLAEIYVQDCQLTDCTIEKIELEALVRMCRDRNIRFNSFILIDKLSQL